MNLLKKLAEKFWKLARELSDEAAYERFLRERGTTPSSQEWRHFCRHRLDAKYQRPKCC